MSLPDDFDKAILANSLSRTSMAPKYSITPMSLNESLISRIERLVYPSRMLQSKGRSLSLGALSWAGFNILVGYWSFTLNYTSAGTTLGLVSLLCTAGLRIAVGRWEKAKQNWIEDYRRVMKSLERDLQDSLKKKLDTQVLLVEKEASTSIRTMIEKRKRDIDDVGDKVTILMNEIATIKNDIH